MEDFISIDIEKTMITAHGVETLCVNTTIYAGEFLTLFGVSGSGKTTLLRILAGLTQPEKGRISCGKTVWFDSSKKINLSPQLRNTGFMFQDYALFPNMTVSENIAYAQKRKDTAKLAELLSLFGLEEFHNRKITMLSGGQKQRVALARTLASTPQLLLLDEPLSALDVAMKNSLQQEIAQTHKNFGITTIMVSHNLSEVFHLSTKVMCIEHGKITHTGSPDDVFCDSSVSGKVQIVGQIAKILKQDAMYIVTVVFGNNQVIKVIAFESDIITMQVGDNVMVYTKAFNPLIMKIA